MWYPPYNLYFCGIKHPGGKALYTWCTTYFTTALPIHYIIYLLICVCHLQKSNIITFNNKYTSLENFEDVHKVIVYEIRNNMNSLADTGVYVATIKQYLDDFTLFVSWSVLWSDSIYSLQTSSFSWHHPVGQLYYFYISGLL